jgi:hypothetical protein
MTSSFNSSMSAAAEPLASRREIVAAVAAAVAGTNGHSRSIRRNREKPVGSLSVQLSVRQAYGSVG